jgi:Tfp pilus assembly protein PilE
MLLAQLTPTCITRTLQKFQCHFTKHSRPHKTASSSARIDNLAHRSSSSHDLKQTFVATAGNAVQQKWQLQQTTHENKEDDNSCELEGLTLYEGQIYAEGEGTRKDMERWSWGLTTATLFESKLYYEGRMR